MEERLARRRELAEQNRLRKQALEDAVKAKVNQHSSNLDILVKKDAVSSKQKDELLDGYEKALWQVHNNKEEGMLRCIINYYYYFF